MKKVMKLALLLSCLLAVTLQLDSDDAQDITCP